MLFTFMLLMKVVCLNVPFSCSNSDLFSKFFKNGKFCNWNYIYPHVHTQTHSHNSLNHKFHNIVFPLLKSVFSYSLSLMFHLKKLFGYDLWNWFYYLIMGQNIALETIVKRRKKPSCSYLCLNSNVAFPLGGKNTYTCVFVCIYMLKCLRILMCYLVI